jgi:hypothetical protein
MAIEQSRDQTITRNEPKVAIFTLCERFEHGGIDAGERIRERGCKHWNAVANFDSMSALRARPSGRPDRFVGPNLVGGCATGADAAWRIHLASIVRAKLFRGNVTLTLLSSL